MSHNLGIETPTEESDKTDSNCGQSTVLPFYMKYSTDPVPTDDDHVPKGSDGRQPYSLGSLTWDKSWTYRRSLSAQPGNPSVASPGDSSNQNFNNDYSGGFLFTSPTLTLAAETSWTGGINKTVLAAAEQRSYGYYHYIKNLGSPNASPYLYMPLDEQTGTGHGLAKTPYLRESRRAKRGLDGFRLLYEHLNASNAQDGGATAMHFYETRLPLGIITMQIFTLCRAAHTRRTLLRPTTPSSPTTFPFGHSLRARSTICSSRARAWRSHSWPTRPRGCTRPSGRLAAQLEPPLHSWCKGVGARLAKSWTR